MHWEVAGIGKYHPLLCAFAALAGSRFFLAVFWHPRFSDRQLTDADGVISLAASEKCSRLGFGSSGMLLSWQWDINNFTTPFERHQWARREAVPRHKPRNGTAWRAFQWLFSFSSNL
jgi:hypothetical protein